MICRLSQHSLERTENLELQSRILLRHQAGCPVCQSIIENNEQMNDSLCELSLHETQDLSRQACVSDSLHQRVMAGIRQADRTSAVQHAPDNRWQNGWTLATVGTITAAVLLTVFLRTPVVDESPAIAQQNDNPRPDMQAMLQQNLPRLNPLTQELALREEIELLKQDFDRFRWRDRSEARQPG